ncbi:predicted protein, partial [Nematostella vectensis]
QDYSQPAVLQDTFAPGETDKVVKIPILNDNVVEPTEKLQVILSSPDATVITEPDTATVTILDDDAEDTKDYTTPADLDLAFEMGETDKIFVVPILDDKLVEPSENFTVKMTSSEPTVVITSDTSTVTIEDDDYAQDITFEAGETTKPIRLPIIDDKLIEDKESFTVRVSSTDAGVIVTPDAAVVTI